jgi:hypothetical protein
MKKLLIILSCIALIGLVACDKLFQDSGLSEDDIVKGLKTALEVGTDSSVTTTSTLNGYFLDKAIKILLPPEAKVIEDNIQYVNQSNVLQALNINLQKYVDNAVVSMNRAAESAAKQAGPIFKNSITSLSITDGLSILNGKNPANLAKGTSAFDSTAATNYLRSTTFDTLVYLYKTPVDHELDKDLGLGFSTNDAWTTLTYNYNLLANAAQSALNADAIFPYLSSSERTILRKFTAITQTSLGQYVTEKALNGLFLKVGDQERDIRRDPWKWASDVVGEILQKVFGK